MTQNDAVPQEVSTEITTVTTDLSDLRQCLEGWIRTRLADPTAVISELRKPSESGMSSISILFAVDWTEDGAQHQADLVARLAPGDSDLPLFPGYDLELQAAVMHTVATHSTVPVPLVRWVEVSPEILGRPFVVMDRVEGVVPGDNPPYVFGSWLHGATSDQLDAVQRASVDLLAQIHAIPDPHVLLPELAGAGRGDALRRHVDTERAYYEWTRIEDGLRIPLLERGFDWLEDHWPERPSEPVLCWGDSRIGNIMYNDFRPAAVLDWEMATVAPRELDVAWFIFFHRMFQDMAEQFGLPGLPSILRRPDVVARYEEVAGVELHDLDFYLVYAAIRFGIIMSRSKRRSIHFDGSPAPDNPDEYILHHHMLRTLLDGDYHWETK
ncbi:phosphotransferase family protein [Rhodococcus sp. ACT016]|uniref:phosphotransferase family protein n=1 Tax=Rhodococcus sp. ACT016 TaxID=3134808 RepID=UPI003D2AAA94